MTNLEAPPQRSAFISYSRNNRNAALEIRNLLITNNVKVWLDVVDIRTSKELLHELFDNIDTQNVFCLLLSPTSVASVWVQEEIRHAIAKPGLQVLPIILQSCQIPDDLRNTVALDARQGFDQESVRSRLLRAICGGDAVPDGILLDHIARELLAKKEIQEAASKELPKIAEFVDSVSQEPIRKIELRFDSDSLPKDPAIILELRVDLDMWQGSFSILVAGYREGETWPDPFRLEEPDYTKFYRVDAPRVDVYFKWLDYIQRMDQTITEWETFPMIFTMEFDGREIRPGGTVPMPTKFEVPPLGELTKNGRQITLRKHQFQSGHEVEVEKETDIRLELRGIIGDTDIRLYSSSTSFQEEAVLESSFFQTEMSRIYQQVILDRYLPDSSVRSIMKKANKAPRRELQNALDTVETDWSNFAFDSAEEQHLAAQFRYSQAGTCYVKYRFRDAYKMYVDTGNLLWELWKTQDLTFRDHMMIFVGCLRSTTIFLKQESYEHALTLLSVLERAVSQILATDPNVPDYQRYRADSLAIGATILGHTNQKDLALERLSSSIAIYSDLHQKLPSEARRLAWLESLTSGVQALQSWGLNDAPELLQWEIVLCKEVGVEVSNELILFRPLDQLPVWLEKATLSGWPTTPIVSHTLRYSLHFPLHWKREFKVRGTDMETEHIYWGSTSQDAEWLYISFMDNAADSQNMNMWVDMCMMICNFPIAAIHEGDKQRRPKIETWRYLGVEPALKKRMRADETHCYMGTAKYQRSYAMMGRMYVLLVRRKSFAWKIILSFKTACFDRMPEQIIASNDHKRAGSIFGELKLDGIGLF